MAIITCTNPHAGEHYDPNKWNNNPDDVREHALLAHKTTFEGCVLYTGEHNYYDDSDFYALVWDDEAGKVREIEYASTRGWSYHNGAKVDATEQVRAKAVQWLAGILLDRYIGEAVAKLTEEAEGIRKGVHVRSTTTRGKNVGVEGVVVWEGVDEYKVSTWARHNTPRENWPKRYGVKVEGEDKLRYLSGDKVERTDKQLVRLLTDEEITELRDKAQWRAQQTYGSK